MKKLFILLVIYSVLVCCVACKSPSVDPSVMINNSSGTDRQTEPTPAATAPSAPKLPAEPLSCQLDYAGLVGVEFKFVYEDKSPEFSELIHSVTELENYLTDKLGGSEVLNIIEYSTFDDTYFQNNSVVIGVVYERDTYTTIRLKEANRLEDGSYHIMIEQGAILTFDTECGYNARVAIIQILGVTDNAPVTVEYIKD